MVLGDRFHNLKKEFLVSINIHVLITLQEGYDDHQKIMSYNKVKKMTSSLTLDLNGMCYGRLCHIISSRK
jgi:hypothetical protein